MRKSALILLLTVALSQATQAQYNKTLTFDEALHIMLTNNPAISASSYEEEAALMERKAAAGLRAPKINAVGTYAYLGKDLGFDLNGLKGPVQGALGNLPTANIPPAILHQAKEVLAADWFLKLQDRSLGTVGGTVTVPVYTGGKINAAVNAAKIKLTEAEESGRQSRNALISELAERYYGYLLSLQVVEVRQQVLDGVRQHLSDAKALEANGIIARSERLFAEVAVAEAEREHFKASRETETIKSALKNTLNSDMEFIPISSLFMLNRLEPVDYYQQLAAQNSPLLRQVDLKRDLAIENVRLHRSDFAPQVALIAGGSAYQYNVTGFLPRWAVGATVSLKIFDGWHREHSFKAAKYQVKQVEALGIKANNDIATLIDGIYNELTVFNEQMISIDASMQFAEEYLRIKQEAFKEGMATSTDVVDAQLNLAKIKTERLEAAYLYDLMLARLLEACGASDTFADYNKRASAVPVRYE